MLDDAAPLFRDGKAVPRAGVLLAIPMLMNTGVLDAAKQVWGSIGPAFYGLRTNIVPMLLMALLRIKRPEGLKEHAPPDLGRVLGLDRAPEVKTLRRKLARLTALGGDELFGRLLAQRRVSSHGRSLATASSNATPSSTVVVSSTSWLTRGFGCSEESCGYGRSRACRAITRRP